jgi:hypothetical protein
MSGGRVLFTPRNRGRADCGHFCTRGWHHSSGFRTEAAVRPTSSVAFYHRYRPVARDRRHHRDVAGRLGRGTAAGSAFDRICRSQRSAVRPQICAQNAGCARQLLVRRPLDAQQSCPQGDILRLTDVTFTKKLIGFARSPVHTLRPSVGRRCTVPELAGQLSGNVRNCRRQDGSSPGRRCLQPALSGSGEGRQTIVRRLWRPRSLARS